MVVRWLFQYVLWMGIECSAEEEKSLSLSLITVESDNAESAEMRCCTMMMYLITMEMVWWFGGSCEPDDGMGLDLLCCMEFQACVTSK